MATNALSAFGTLLKRGDGSGPPEVFTTIAEVKDISGPALGLGTEEVTAHDGTGWREFIPTLLEGGEVTFDINYYSGATQDNLRTDMTNKTKRTFQIVFVPITPDETWEFKAYVTSFEISAPVEGALTASVTLMITDSVTVT